ncbi:putative protein TPRXL [Strongylocentrotus purpuratus]|uniref:Uncharacterized protein n=1 Tax=Strongylocentrotus purpuratus TaxID=7668 RepID=A0A7M7NUQ7_STRPU|nr:putative protein TPRXL [Strongylocentrotus purpuratus]
MPSAQQWRVTSLCTFVLFCWMIMNRPFLVEGEFSCYKGSVDIVNGELRVASTKSIVLQQCSPPTTQQPPSPATGVNGTGQPATSQSSNQTTPPSTASADNVTTPSGNNASSSGNSTTPSSSTTPGNETTPDNSTTPSPTSASASPEAPSGNSNSSVNETSTTPPPLTNVSAPMTPGPSSAATTSRATPGGTPGATDGATNGTTTAPPATTSTTSAGDGSLIGCVVTKTYQNGSRDNMTVSFSCPVPDSPCNDVGFNGSTENQVRIQFILANVTVKDIDQ